MLRCRLNEERAAPPPPPSPPTVTGLAQFLQVLIVLPFQFYERGGDGDGERCSPAGAAVEWKLIDEWKMGTHA